MKRFNNILLILKSNRFNLILVPICVIFYCFAIFCSLPNNNKAIINMLTSLNGYNGILGINSYITILTPMIVIIINSIINKKEDISFILKNKTRNKLFYSNILTILRISFFLTLFTIILGYILGVIYTNSFYDIWPQNDSTYLLSEYVDIDVLSILKEHKLYFIISIIFLMRFFSIFIIGMISYISKNILKNDFNVFLLVNTIILSDYFLLDGNILMNKISLDISIWVNHNDIIIRLAYLSFLVAIFYIIGKEINSSKDFI